MADLKQRAYILCRHGVTTDPPQAGFVPKLPQPCRTGHLGGFSGRVGFGERKMGLSCRFQSSNNTSCLSIMVTETTERRKATSQLQEVSVCHGGTGMAEQFRSYAADDRNRGRV